MHRRAARPASRDPLIEPLGPELVFGRASDRGLEVVGVDQVVEPGFAFRPGGLLAPVGLRGRSPPGEEERRVLGDPGRHLDAVTEQLVCDGVLSVALRPYTGSGDRDDQRIDVGAEASVSTSHNSRFWWAWSSSTIAREMFKPF